MTHWLQQQDALDEARNRSVRLDALLHAERERRERAVETTTRELTQRDEEVRRLRRAYDIEVRRSELAEIELRRLREEVRSAAVLGAFAGVTLALLALGLLFVFVH